MKHRYTDRDWKLIIVQIYGIQHSELYILHSKYKLTKYVFLYWLTEIIYAVVNSVVDIWCHWQTYLIPFEVYLTPENSPCNETNKPLIGSQYHHVDRIVKGQVLPNVAKKCKRLKIWLNCVPEPRDTSQYELNRGILILKYDDMTESTDCFNASLMWIAHISVRSIH